MSKLAPVVGVCVSVRLSLVWLIVPPGMPVSVSFNCVITRLHGTLLGLIWLKSETLTTSGEEWVWKKNYLVEHFPFVSGCLRLPVMAWLGNPITHTRTLACWAVAAFIFFAFISVQVHISFKCQAMFVLGFHSCSYICPNHRQCLLLAFFLVIQYCILTILHNIAYSQYCTILYTHWI